jgi:EmrB/QacA subfamily drug resistance transporter
VSDLGGLEQLSWVVTAYLLTSTAMTPLWGKISDLYGRRIIFQAAITIFIVGSLLCGLSQDMFQLIVFRAIQGIGGGGLFAIAFAVIGDIIPARERGRYQGYFGAVFGVSSVAGPLLGGFFTDGLGWRWIFYINLPIGIAALIVTSIALKLPVVRREHSIDYVGATLIVGSVSSLLLYLNWAGEAYGWLGPGPLGLIVLSIVLAAAFLVAERRAAEPIVPLNLFRNRIFSIGNSFGFLAGFAMFGGILYLPLYFQTAMGLSPTRSGLAMLPMIFGLLTFSITSGALITKTGRYKIFPIAGAILIITALLLLSGIEVDTPYWRIGIFAFLFGGGLGLTLQTITVAVQNSVEFRDMGVATSSVQFTRSLGGAIGAATLGAVLNTRLANRIADLDLGANAATVERSLSNVQAIKTLPEPVKTTILVAYTDAITYAFRFAVPGVVVALIVALFLKEIPLRRGAPVTADELDEANRPAEIRDAGHSGETRDSAPAISGR